MSIKINITINGCKNVEVVVSEEPTLIPVDVDQFESEPTVAVATESESPADESKPETPDDDLIEFDDEPAEDPGEDDGGFYVEVTGAKMLDDEPAEELKPAGDPPTDDVDPIAAIMDDVHVTHNPAVAFPEDNEA